MHVQYMQTESSPLQIEDQNLTISPLVLPTLKSSPVVKESTIQLDITPSSGQRAVLIESQNIDIADQYYFHCSEWISSGCITAENLNILTLQKLIEKPKS